MAEVPNTIGMATVGVINIASCYSAALATYRAGQRLNVAITTPWCLLQISYGTMPFFGLWDDLLLIAKENRVLNGFSAFFSMMTIMFLVSATLIDNSICNMAWTRTHAFIYILVIAPFWLCLFLVPALDSVAYTIYPPVMLPIAVPCLASIVYYLWRLGILCGAAGLILCMSFTFSVLGFASLTLWSKEEPARMYGWYIFCWLSVILLYALWRYVHVVRKLDNHREQSEDPEQSYASDVAMTDYESAGNDPHEVDSKKNL